MAEAFYMDPDGVRHAVSQIHAVGAFLDRSLLHLNGVLDEHDGCWGEDSIGKGFSDNYVKPATETRGYGRKLTDGVVKLGEEVDDTEGTFEGVDSETAQDMDSHYNS
jgi:hypothetical protein